MLKVRTLRGKANLGNGKGGDLNDLIIKGKTLNLNIKIKLNG